VEPTPLLDMAIHAYIQKGSIIVENTGYGTAWQNTDGRLFVMFYGSNKAYEITADEAVDGRLVSVDCTIEQTLGSWGPTQDFRRYLEKRTEEREGVRAYFSTFGGSRKDHPWQKHQPMGPL